MAAVHYNEAHKTEVHKTKTPNIEKLTALLTNEMI